MSLQRPSPEKLLKRVQEEENQKKRGKLKIFFGAAPGVGKTYSMLQDAMDKRAQGLDVVVGIVETHGRREVIALLKDLEILARQSIDYHGKEILEFDLDAALKRAPGLILMDEMAHTNPSGLRHAKRWQDIKELLDRGIDVYTTLNVQHVDSLADVVSQILHTRVKETVPDSMIEMAETIELVDLPPEDLLKRLQEGKVYFPETIEFAKEHFFRKGNLIALRELALRLTAERVGAQVLLYRQGLGIKHIWPTKEKFLVCVGSRTESAKVIRTARRLATSLQTEWIAIHVDSPRLQQSEEERNNAIQNLRLAEQLGAETRILTGNDIVQEILTFARERNVTTIVVWKRNRSRWKDFLLKSLANEIVRNSKEIDVYIVTGESDVPTLHKKQMFLKPSINWKSYVASIVMVAIATFINFLIYPFLESSNLFLIYLLGVTFIGLYGRVGPSFVASLLSVLVYDYFFIPPFYSLYVESVHSLFTLGVLLIITLIISNLTIISRKQSEASKSVESHTASLHKLSRQLASTRGIDKLLTTALCFIGEEFNSDVMALLPANDHLEIRAKCGTDATLNEKDKSVAQWVFDLGQKAGLGTDTLPFSNAIYLPLLATQGTIGVLRIRPLQAGHLFTPEEMHLIEACVNQIALALEVDHFQEVIKKTEVQTESDRARNALLQTVSRDIRTPLVASIGAASTLIEMGKELEPAQVKKLGSAIYFELETLSRLINNLLQLSYLEAEQVKLQKEFHSVQHLITQVVESEKKKLENRDVIVNMPKDLPEVPFDYTLMQDVLINLIENAIKFTPKGSPIEITVVYNHYSLLISVEDRGPGIVADEVKKLFEKFYRGRMLTTERGMGLGLAICRYIIKAHGGKIWAENRPGGGAAFKFTLPLESSDNKL